MTGAGNLMFTSELRLCRMAFCTDRTALLSGMLSHFENKLLRKKTFPYIDLKNPKGRG